MELEQRVKALEYEMKVLKSEIQRTLLDIQEQILVHYYPALRTEETGVPESAVQTVEALRARPSGPDGDSGASRAAKPDGLDAARGAAEQNQPLAVRVSEPGNSAPQPEPARTETPAPKVRQVTLDEVRSTQVETLSPETTSQMSRLLEWALNGAAQIGLERLKPLIQQAAKQKILSPDLQDVLIRIAPLNRRTAPDTVGMREVIQVITQLDVILGRPTDIQEALALIEEAKIG
ncbi:MAG: hypothetical protein HY741_05415 [Chloroflexi bacterium]|nr:hypothetical protein [Chloroflexota bacterium]